MRVYNYSVRKEGKKIMKVYAIVFDYQGYEETVIGIFSTCEKVKEYFMEEFNKCKYTNDIKKYLKDTEYSFIEWEVNTNKKRKIKISL